MCPRFGCSFVYLFMVARVYFARLSLFTDVYIRGLGLGLPSGGNWGWGWHCECSVRVEGGVEFGVRSRVGVESGG